MSLIEFCSDIERIERTLWLAEAKVIVRGPDVRLFQRAGYRRAMMETFVTCFFSKLGLSEPHEMGDRVPVWQRPARLEKLTARRGAANEHLQAECRGYANASNAISSHDKVNSTTASVAWRAVAEGQAP